MFYQQLHFLSLGQNMENYHGKLSLTNECWLNECEKFLTNVDFCLQT